MTPFELFILFGVVVVIVALIGEAVADECPSCGGRDVFHDDRYRVKYCFTCHRNFR